jgi:hypothetical protein
MAPSGVSALVHLSTSGGGRACSPWPRHPPMAPPCPLPPWPLACPTPPVHGQLASVWLSSDEVIVNLLDRFQMLEWALAKNPVLGSSRSAASHLVLVGWACGVAWARLWAVPVCLRACDCAGCGARVRAFVWLHRERRVCGCASSRDHASVCECVLCTGVSEVECTPSPPSS